MGLFGFGKKKEVLDLTEGYKRQIEKAEQAKREQENQQSSVGNGPFSFFDSQTNTDSQGPSINETPEERKRRLAKRLVEMTEKLEDVSNQIYHLQQRIEVLERKSNVRLE